MADDGEAIDPDGLVGGSATCMGRPMGRKSRMFTMVFAGICRRSEMSMVAVVALRAQSEEPEAHWTHSARSGTSPPSLQHWLPWAKMLGSGWCGGGRQ